jgi:hypothetical protein
VYFPSNHVKAKKEVPKTEESGKGGVVRSPLTDTKLQLIRRIKFWYSSAKCD